jgi:hypothetical protein
MLLRRTAATHRMPVGCAPAHRGPVGAGSTRDGAGTAHAGSESTAEHAGLIAGRARSHTEFLLDVLRLTAATQRMPGGCASAHRGPVGAGSTRDGAGTAYTCSESSAEHAGPIAGRARSHIGIVLDVAPAHRCHPQGRIISRRLWERRGGGPWRLASRAGR